MKQQPRPTDCYFAHVGA